MGGLFGGLFGRSSRMMSAALSAVHPPPPPVVIPQYIPAPRDNTAEVKAAEERQRKAMALAKGRQSTLLTGGRGIEETATVGRKTLLGE